MFIFGIALNLEVIEFLVSFKFVQNSHLIYSKRRVGWLCVHWTHNQPTGSDRLHSHGTTPHAAKIQLSRQLLRLGTRQPETC